MMRRSTHSGCFSTEHDMAGVHRGIQQCMHCFDIAVCLLTLPDSGVWKKIATATLSAVSRATTTGMHNKESTVIADTQQDMTALGLPSPCAWEPNVSSPVDTPNKKYQQKLNHCRHTHDQLSIKRTGSGHFSDSRLER